MERVTLVIILTAFAALVATIVLRVRIFRSIDFDRVATPLLGDSSIIGIGDFLFVRLYRARAKIDPQFRPMIFWFFWAHIIYAALLILAVVIDGLSA